MRINIDVKMKSKYIYDLLLYHTYSKFSGFMINILGLAVIVMGGLSLGMGRIDMLQCAVFLVAGFAILAFTPLTLKRRSSQFMRDEKYQNILSYSFDSVGIEENVGRGSHFYAWNEVTKAIATPKNIAFYVQDDTAIIVPKECFGENFMPVMKLIAENMTRDKIYIR